jgi:hypothetical protein
MSIARLGFLFLAVALNDSTAKETDPESSRVEEVLRDFTDVKRQREASEILKDILPTLNKSFHVREKDVAEALSKQEGPGVMVMGQSHHDGLVQDLKKACEAPSTGASKAAPLVN